MEGEENEEEVARNVEYAFEEAGGPREKDIYSNTPTRSDNC